MKHMRSKNKWDMREKHKRKMSATGQTHFTRSCDAPRNTASERYKACDSKDGKSHQPGCHKGLHAGFSRDKCDAMHGLATRSLIHQHYCVLCLDVKTED